jgi:hypothetical protein
VERVVAADCCFVAAALSDLLDRVDSQDKGAVTLFSRSPSSALSLAATIQGDADDFEFGILKMYLSPSVLGCRWSMVFMMAARFPIGVSTLVP